jgi:hypothetical protein
MERTFDPILVEVVKHELAAITEEMAIAGSGVCGAVSTRDLHRGHGSSHG